MISDGNLTQHFKLSPGTSIDPHVTDSLTDWLPILKIATKDHSLWETCDLWDIWSEWWGNMTWPTFWQFLQFFTSFFTGKEATVTRRQGTRQQGWSEQYGLRHEWRTTPHRNSIKILGPYRWKRKVYREGKTQECRKQRNGVKREYKEAAAPAPGSNFPGPNLPGPNLPGPNLPGSNLPGPNLWWIFPK